MYFKMGLELKWGSNYLFQLRKYTSDGIVVMENCEDNWQIMDEWHIEDCGFCKIKRD